MPECQAELDIERFLLRLPDTHPSGQAGQGRRACLDLWFLRVQIMLALKQVHTASEHAPSRTCQDTRIVIA